MSKTYSLGLKQIENMHGHWFIYLGKQGHEFLGNALHFIQMTWFTYAFAKIHRMPT